MAELKASKSEAPFWSWTMASPSMMADKQGSLAAARDNGRIAVAPIVSIAGEYARIPPLKQHLAAIAIVFDFVNPVLAFRRLIDGGSKLGLNEFEPRGY